MMLMWDRKGKTTTPRLVIIQKLKKSAGIAASLMGAGGSLSPIYRGILSAQQYQCPNNRQLKWDWHKAHGDGTNTALSGSREAAAFIRNLAKSRQTHMTEEGLLLGEHS